MMLDDLLDLKIFDRVATMGSLSAAARSLDLSLAVVSKRLAGLEKRLGMVLMHRTTRSNALTADGQAFHARCVRILLEVHAAEIFVSGRQEHMGGLLTLTAPRNFGRQYVVPLVAEFQSRHPDLSFKLLFSDEIVDLSGGGSGNGSGSIDLAFRFGALLDSTLTAREIAPSSLLLCASPAYIERRGAPRQPSDLLQHACIVYGARPDAQWLFQAAGKSVVAPVRATFMVNDGEAAQALALAGAGIFFKSVWDVGSHLKAGRLVRVMTDFSAPSKSLNAVFPHGRVLAPRVRQFIDFAIERLRADWENELKTLG